MSVGPLFAAESLGKSYRRRKVLTSASLWANTGTITVVVGRNGSGKTTLLKTAAGWLKPDYGLVRFRDERFVRPRLAQLAARGLFFLPDRSLLSPAFTLMQHFAAMERRFGLKNMVGVAQLLEVSHLLDRSPETLSSGERRRAELALALARAPTCLLADDPFRGIPPQTTEILAAAFRRLAEDGCAVVLTGQEVPLLMGAADQVIWVTAGTTHMLGRPAEAERHDQFRREFLGH